MQNFTTRRATITDAESVAQVQYEGWQDTYKHIFPTSFLRALPVRTNMWTEILSDPSPGGFNEVLVHPQNEVIGFISGGPNRASELKVEGEIYALYLLTDYHGKGLGKQLFLQGIKCLRQSGYKSFCVFVLTQNPHIGFYRKFKPDMQILVKDKIGGVEYDEAGLGWSDINRAGLLL